LSTKTPQLIVAGFCISQMNTHILNVLKQAPFNSGFFNFAEND